MTPESGRSCDPPIDAFKGLVGGLQATGKEERAGVGMGTAGEPCEGCGPAGSGAARFLRIRGMLGNISSIIC